METTSVVVGLRFVRLSHLEFLYLRKWMHQNYSRKETNKVFFPGGVVLSPSTDKDLEEIPALRIFQDPEKIIYLLRGPEEFLDRCSRIINVWYREYKNEVAHYWATGQKVFSSAEQEIGEKQQPSFNHRSTRSQLEKLQSKFKCTNSFTKN